MFVVHIMYVVVVFFCQTVKQLWFILLFKWKKLVNRQWNTGQVGGAYDSQMWLLGADQPEELHSNLTLVSRYHFLCKKKKKKKILSIMKSLVMWNWLTEVQIHRQRKGTLIWFQQQKWKRCHLSWWSCPRAPLDLQPEGANTQHGLGKL